MSFTAEHAKKVVEANLVNLAKKAAAGKTLTAQELSLVTSIIEEGDPLRTPPFVDNQVALAKVLGVERKTIQRWLKDPDCPPTAANGKYNVLAWREWVRKTGRKTGEPEPDIDATFERARNILLQNQRIEFQLGILRKEYVSSIEVEQWGAELGTAIRKVVGQLHLQAPSLVGLPVAELEARLKEVEDEVISQLNSLGASMERWRAEIDSVAVKEANNESTG